MTYSVTYIQDETATGGLLSSTEYWLSYIREWLMKRLHLLLNIDNTVYRTLKVMEDEREPNARQLTLTLSRAMQIINTSNRDIAS